MKFGYLPNRRMSILGGASATLALMQGFSPSNALAQTGRPAAGGGIASLFAGFEPRVTVGNTTGAALKSVNYQRLAEEAPRGLIQSFGLAIGGNARRVMTASRDYIDYRRMKSDRDLATTSQSVSKDVGADAKIARALIGAMEQDLATGQQLLNGSLGLAEFRAELNVLRSQLDLLRLERARSMESNTIYVVVVPEISRTGTDYTPRLIGEIEQLRVELDLLKQRSAQLEALALRVG